MKTSWQDTLQQGLVAGLIGYATVGLVFGLVDVIQGHSPFYTAAVLGATLFYGIQDPIQVTVAAPYVFAYSGFHLLLFLVLGMAGAWLADLAELGEQLWFVGLFFFIFVAFHIFGAVQAMAAPVQAALSPVAIWLGGTLASVLMAAYLLWEHPLIRKAQAW